MEWNTPDTTESDSSATTENESETGHMQIDQIPTLEVTEIGIPYSSLPAQARIPWDLFLYDGYLYVGAGNYNDNLSPKQFMRYHITESVWENCGIVSDEQIARFLLIGEELMVPGIDPTGDWSRGNYYVLEGNEFSIQRVIPDAIHTFDMVEYDGKIFTGDGVHGGKFPVSVAQSQTQDFIRVPFYKEGNLLDTSANTEVRVYDFFVCNNTLYAFLTLDAERTIYRYDGEAFVYDNKWSNKIVLLRDDTHVPIRAKGNLNGNIYFTTGILYVTKDMKNLSAVDVGDSERITDIALYDNICYALGYRKLSDGRYENRIYVLSDHDAHLTASFIGDAPAVSFACTHDTWYFGFSSPYVGYIATAARDDDIR